MICQIYMPILNYKSQNFEPQAIFRLNYYQGKTDILGYSEFFPMFSFITFTSRGIQRKT